MNSHTAVSVQQAYLRLKYLYRQRSGWRRIADGKYTGVFLEAFRTDQLGPERLPTRLLVTKEPAIRTIANILLEQLDARILLEKRNLQILCHETEPKTQDPGQNAPGT